MRLAAGLNTRQSRLSAGPGTMSSPMLTADGTRLPLPPGLARPRAGPAQPDGRGGQGRGDPGPAPPAGCAPPPGRLSPPCLVRARVATPVRLVPSERWAVLIVTPQTILTRHEALVRRRRTHPPRRLGRPQLPEGTVESIVAWPTSTNTGVHAHRRRAQETRHGGVEDDRRERLVPPRPPTSAEARGSTGSSSAGSRRKASWRPTPSPSTRSRCAASMSSSLSRSTGDGSTCSGPRQSHRCLGHPGSCATSQPRLNRPPAPITTANSSGPTAESELDQRQALAVSAPAFSYGAGSSCMAARRIPPPPELCPPSGHGGRRRVLGP